MQGDESPKQIAQTIKIINKDNKMDIIIIIRGGGSIQDLSGFDDENLVNNIFESKIPIICGIGHEKDKSLSDLVCDYSASTPTGVANYLTDGINIKNSLNDLNNLVIEKYNDLIEFEGERIIDLRNDTSDKFDNLIELFNDKYEEVKENISNKLNTKSNIYIEDKNISSCKELKSIKNKEIKCYFPDGIAILNVNSIEIESLNDISKDISKIIEKHKLPKKFNFNNSSSYNNIIKSFNIDNIYKKNFSDNLKNYLNNILYYRSQIEKMNEQLEEENDEKSLTKNYECDIKHIKQFIKSNNNKITFDEINEFISSLLRCIKHYNYIQSNKLNSKLNLETEYDIEQHVKQFTKIKELNDKNYKFYEKLSSQIKHKIKVQNKSILSLYYKDEKEDIIKLLNL